MVDIPGDGRKGSPPEPSLSTEIRELIAALRADVRDLREEVQALRSDSPKDGESALLTRQETADRLGISTRLLDDLADQGEIEPVRIKGRVLYEPEEVAGFVRSRAGEGSSDE